MDESNQREKTRDNESHNASKQHVVDPRSERANRLRDFEELHSHYSRSFLVSQFDNDAFFFKSAINRSSLGRNLVFSLFVILIDIIYAVYR